MNNENKIIYFWTNNTLKTQSLSRFQTPQLFFLLLLLKKKKEIATESPWLQHRDNDLNACKLLL